MVHQIVKQPDGLLAVWSTVVDDWLMTGATEREVLERELHDGRNRDRVELAIERAMGRIEPINDGYPPDTFESLDNWRRLMHERVPCARCTHDEITHDGGQGPCDSDEPCACEVFAAPLPPAGVG